LQENDAKTDKRILVLSLITKLREQLELTQQLLVLLPPDQLAWRPVDNAFRVGELLGHLLDCLAGFCAALYAVRPDELKHFQSLRLHQVNHFCSIEEAQQRLAEYQSFIEEGFAALDDKDLAKRLPTLFASEGETVLSVLLNNLEHFINHKYQLFFYLKLLGVEVATPNLYYFRGASEAVSQSETP